jgi:hypothetical protein
MNRKKWKTLSSYAVVVTLFTFKLALDSSMLQGQWAIPCLRHSPMTNAAHTNGYC